MQCRGYPCSSCASCASSWAGSVELQHWSSCGSSRCTTPRNSTVVLLKMKQLAFSSGRFTIILTRRQPASFGTYICMGIELNAVQYRMQCHNICSLYVSLSCGCASAVYVFVTAFYTLTYSLPVESSCRNQQYTLACHCALALWA